MAIVINVTSDDILAIFILSFFFISAFTAVIREIKTHAYGKRQTAD